ncbi:AraC family transcriptional regulator ligand-binding domain-containing protein [Larkinella soli]|uniref:AraC family transcriptional regulator ligand-binding domain-containing protein n=1 Tax=Larkinella soli TaxID=1770527 RepID=UPI000FFB12C9|nr:AraC family transcriptional regulator ligand-binding domain-containing protein [Larkinella soli]
MSTTLSSVHLMNLLEYAACKGLDPAPLRRLLYTPESELTGEQGRVTLDEYRQVWEQLLRLSGDPHLGLHFGCFLNLKGLGLIYRISLETSSIGQAMSLLETYLNRTFPVVRLVTGVSRDHFLIELHSDLPNDTIRRQVLDSVLFLMVRELGVMIEGEIDEVQLPGEDLTEYRRLCPAPVARAEVHRLRLDARQVAGEINRRRLKNIEMLLPAFLRLVDRSAGGPVCFAEQVRLMTLSLCSPELPGLDEVVAQFAMSHRTFQRRLTDERTSFRAIADDLKRQLSEFLEQGHSLGTQDIAYILGYSGPSAYLHAVKKWRTRRPADRAAA